MPRLMDTEEVMQQTGPGAFQFSGVRVENLGASEYTLVTIVIDVSGSVYNFAAELLNMVKTIVEACQKSPRAENLMIRYLVFNHNVTEIHGFRLLKDIDPNDYEALDPDGYTALFDASYDAIGATIDYSTRLVDDYEFDVNGAVYIVTDGMNNRGSMTPKSIKDKTSGAVSREKIESLITSSWMSEMQLLANWPSWQTLFPKVLAARVNPLAQEHRVRISHSKIQGSPYFIRTPTSKEATMKKIIPIFLIFLFFLAGCNSAPQPAIEKDTNIFTSKTHGDISIFPIYKHLGEKRNTEGKGIRTYNVWENPHENKYIMILQIVPKEGTFPEDLVWTPANGRLYVKGLKAAYNSIGSRPYSIMMKLGAKFPDCFILAEEVHVAPREALFRILIVPDKMCAEEYEPVMEELDRVAIINPLG